VSRWGTGTSSTESRASDAGGALADHEVARAQAPAVRTAVGLDGGVEVAVLGQRDGDLLDQPLGPLQRPAAADAQSGSDAIRGIADERDAGAGGGAADVGDVELADLLGLTRRGVQGGPRATRRRAISRGRLRRARPARLGHQVFLPHPEVGDRRRAREKPQDDHRPPRTLNRDPGAGRVRTQAKRTRSSRARLIVASYALGRYACGMPSRSTSGRFFLLGSSSLVFSRRAGGWARASIDPFLVRLLERALAAIGPADSEARVRPGSPTPGTISPRCS
jgi:hypothetical protein